MALHGHYSDNDYKNWVRACLGLKLLKEGLVDYVDNEVQTFHKDILRTICGLTTCNGCTIDDLTKRRQPCPNNVCDKIRDRIQTEFRYKHPQWENTDATKWCTDYWEIAKCFMSKGSKTMTCPADTDTTGILSVCINGLFMPMSGMIVPAHQQPPVDIFHKNREARNTILHSGPMSLRDIERQDYIQDMIALLNNYKHHHVTKEAIDNLTQLNTGIVITSTDEVAALKLAQQATETKINAMQEELGRVCSDLANKVDTVKLEQEQELTKQRNDGLIERIRDLESHVENVEKGLEHVQSDVQDVKGKVNDVKDEVHDIKGELQDVKDEIHDAKGKVKDVKDEVHDVKSKLHDIKDEVHEAISEVQDVKDEIHDAKGEVQDVKDEVHDVKSKFQDVKDEIHEAISKVQDVKDEVQGEVQDVKYEVQEMKGKVQNLDEKVQKMYEGSCVPETRNAKNDIQKYLLEKYKDLSTISMSPLLQRIKANIDDVYSELLIRDDLVHKGMKQSARNTDSVENYQAIVNDDGKPCKNIYVVGTAGIGKTTWSRKLVCTWCDILSKNESKTVSTMNKSTLQKYCYDLVFYIELRRAKAHSHLLEMIENQLFPHQPALMTHVKTLMESSEDSSRCLIVLDGLDEWVSRAQSTTTDGLPARDPRWKSTIITTTRSWKLEELQLEPQKIDRAVEILGLEGDVAGRLVQKVVSTLNASTRKNKDVEEFRAQCNQSIIKCLNVPLLLNIFVCLWYEEGHIDELLAQTFCGLVELLIKHAEGDSRRGLFQKISPDTLRKAKEAWRDAVTDVPSCLATRRRCSMYAPLLNRLGKIAFDHLFSHAREATLVFTYQSISDIISEDELQLALDTGLLSQTTHCGGSVLDEEFSLSFLHKTVQEYLAALYMVYDETQSNACLNTYQKYCTDVYKILEMENVLMFVSGMCPEVAGKMSCHIATMERDASVHKLLLRCVRQERIVSSTSRQIYIKHHFLYSVDHGVNCNADTVSLLSESNDKDKTLYLYSDVDEQVVQCLADLRHVKLVDAVFHLDQRQSIKLCFSELPALPRSNDNIKTDSVCSEIHVPGAYLQNLKINSYNSNTDDQFTLDLSGCKSLRTMNYMQSSVPIQLPTEQLEKVNISGYTPSTAPVLDLSGCRSLRTVHYKRSTVPIQLPTEQLEKVTITGYTPNTTPLLDLSGCKYLRTVRYKESTTPIQLPIEQLEKVEITNYKPSTATVLDLSGCKSLRTVCYKQSTAPIQLPTEQLEKVDISGYTPSTAPVLDLSGCRSLRIVEYKWSTVPIQLPTEQLEKVDIYGYTPSTAPVLDLSGCKSLKTVCYRESTAPIQLPTKQLEKVDIYFYTPNTAPLLDLSGCQSLRSVHYWHSTAPIQLLATEQLENVDIYGYTPSTAPVLDLSGCKSLKTVCYIASTAPIQLPTEQLERVDISGYKPSTASMLDLSGCKSLRTVYYKESTVPIQLPTKQLEMVEIDITGYKPNISPVLDLSGCQSLRTVCYKESTVPIQLPTEQLERVDISGYTPSTAPILDLSGCKSLISVRYQGSTVPIQLPTEQLERVDISDYKPNTAPLLDLSGCKSLKIVWYKESTAPIQLPTEQLEMVDIYGYKPTTAPLLDLSGCQSLRSVQYWHSTAPIQLLATEQLERVDIYDYKPNTAPLLDLSGCKSLKTVCYIASTAPIQLPTEQLESVDIYGYTPSTAPVLDLSGCKSLTSVGYNQSTVPIQLPTEQLVTVYISGYKPNNAPVLDLSGCTSKTTLVYLNSSIHIKLPDKPIMNLIVDESIRKSIGTKHSGHLVTDICGSE